MGSIFNLYDVARKKSIADYISENIVEGNSSDPQGKNIVFLATNGSWQRRYLSLYEMLHDKYISRYCAKLLLEDFLDKQKQLILEIQKTEQDHRKLHKKLYQAVAFDKIITITVSSQLIGVALRNLIRDDDRYYFLRDPAVLNRLKSCPSLLRFSSYYSFEEEKPFSEINEGDRVILVNDVISTGALVFKLFPRLNKRHAKIKGVFSIADARVPESLLLRNKGVVPGVLDTDSINESIYYYGSEKEEALFSSLVLYNEKDTVLRKFARPYTGAANVKRINPLLNTIVELETRHSEEKRILFPEPEKLLNDKILNPIHFKVGHFRQNISHNGYLTDMHKLFSVEGNESGGKKLVEALRDEMDRLFTSQPDALSRFNTALQSLRSLKQDLGNHRDLDKATELIINAVKQYRGIPLAKQKFKPDYIFYPPFSGIEQLNEKLLSDYFGTQIENIICLQRFDTKKGWRFPFPAKWYNYLTRDKSVLILDSGSLTGESLVQLVDSISFLDVKQITVLCAFTRIEDFYREFYSRLKNIKVKSLHARPENIQGETEWEQHIIPLDIIFGVNLSIPVFPTKVSCPFCEELAILRSCKELEKEKYHSPSTKEYIISRMTEIKETNLEQLENYEVPAYLPRVKKKGTIDSMEIFLMRDRIGKIDSYRFFQDYFDYFDQLKKRIEERGLTAPGNLKDIELILIVIIHEPALYRTVRDLLIDISDYCYQLLKKIVFQNSILPGELYFQWSRYGLVRLVYIFWKDRCFADCRMESLLKFGLNDHDCLNYLSFLLWKGFFRINESTETVTLVSDTLFQLSQKFDHVSNKGISKENIWSSNPIFSSVKIRDLVKDITEHLKNTPTTNVNQAYYNLLKFFVRKASKNTHDELSRFIARLSVSIQNPPTPELVNRIYNETNTIISSLRKDVFDNLTVIRDAKEIAKLQETNYELLFDKKKSVYADFTSIYESYRLLKAPGESDGKEENEYLFKLRQIVYDLQDFQSRYLLKHTPFYDYVLRFRCDLNKTIRDAVKSGDAEQGIKKLNGFACEISGEGEFFINAHEELLVNAFAEIVVNASSEQLNEDSVLKFTITKVDDQTIKLEIDQKAPFRENGAHTGGFSKEVLPVLSVFGIMGSLLINKTPSFKIEVKFSSQILKNM